MFCNLEEMFNSIVGYQTIFEKRNFVANGVGKLPWSHQYVGQDGMVVEVAGNKWVSYDKDGNNIDSGTTPDELALSFKLIYGNVN